MRLKDLANPLFMATCGLSLGLSFLPAAQAETSAGDMPRALSQSQDCQLDPAISYDTENRAWMAVEAVTADQLPVTFDLHIDVELPGVVDDYNALLCQSMTNHLYRLAALSYQERLLALPYHELPENAAAIPRAVMSELNEFLGDLGESGSALRVKGLDLQNARAPGLEPAHARAMLMEGIRYAYETQDLNVVTAQSWDGHAARLEFAVDYQPRQAAWYAMGPDDEGIRRNVLAAVQDEFRRLAPTRAAACLEDDMDYITADIENALRDDEILMEYIHLFDVRVGTIDLVGANLENSPPVPQNPVCISDLEKKYGADSPAP